MRAVRALTGVATSSSEQPWLPGLLHAVLGLAPALVFGLSACLSGLLFATLASFVVYLPLTALALNGGQAIDTDTSAPALTPGAQLALLALWTATAWGAAAVAA